MREQKMKGKLGVAYLAPEGYEEQLSAELKGVTERFGRLFITDRPLQRALWVQNIWLNPEVISFETISQAATALKNLQRNWSQYPFSEHRRAALIEEKLPFIGRKPLVFPSELPKAPMGSWMLIDKNTLIASSNCSSIYGNGEVHFQECKEGPPSRAYLKLWEALTVAGKRPGKGNTCLEIGASPGGWTWVLAQLETRVTCVDRSPLDPSVSCLPGVTFKSGNGFGMTPESFGAVDWIFSDVACYPEKLLEWIHLWLSSGKCKNFVCTLKFQGEASYDVAEDYLKIPGSRLLHLHHNKHELTWIYSSENQ